MSQFQLNGPEPYVLAELANAHNGNFDQLLAMIEAAAKTGAQGIKFAWFQADTTATPDYEWYPVYQKLVFTAEQWNRAVETAKRSSLEVWVDIGDEWALGQIEQCRDAIYGLKIPPSVLLDRGLTHAALSFGKPTLLGLGGHDDAAIQRHVEALRKINPCLILEHGFQAYPTKPEDATLRRLAFLRDRYGLPVAFADHEAGDSELALRLPEYAYFAGAMLIEKHLCLDRSLKPYDYYSSLEPHEFRALVENLRRCRTIMGGVEITEAQRNYLRNSTRAILVKPVQNGETVTAHDVKYRCTPDQAALWPDAAEDALPAVALSSLSAGQPLKAAHLRPLRIVAVVPCRMKSSRLKHKAVLPIHGVSSIERCLINAMKIRGLSATVLATSTHPDDAVLEKHAREAGAGFLRGSEEDVLERFLAIADQTDPDIMLRITGDCPVVSYEIADYLIQSHLETKADVTYCAGPFAVGTNSEVYRISSLRRLRELVPATGFSEASSEVVENAGWK